ncbi:hypothetical protein PMAYCL1PPCAC_29847, partial [Pristionchus mayeri]
LLLALFFSFSLMVLQGLAGYLINCPASLAFSLLLNVLLSSGFLLLQFVVVDEEVTSLSDSMKNWGRIHTERSPYTIIP